MCNKLLHREKDKSEGSCYDSKDLIPTKGVFRFSRAKERTFYFYSALVMFIIYVISCFIEF